MNPGGLRKSGDAIGLKPIGGVLIMGDPGSGGVIVTLNDGGQTI